MLDTLISHKAYVFNLIKLPQIKYLVIKLDIKYIIIFLTDNFSLRIYPNVYRYWNVVFVKRSLPWMV